MSIIFDMFVPSRRHLDDERNRLEWTRDEDGLGDPHRGPIDLDSGVVTIKPTDENDESRETGETAEGDTVPLLSEPAKP